MNRELGHFIDFLNNFCIGAVEKSQPGEI